MLFHFKRLTEELFRNDCKKFRFICGAIGIQEGLGVIPKIRTIENVDISTPNAMVLSSHLINYSSSAQEHVLILHTGVSIGYDAPWRQVHELLIAATF
jgi:hypothetical protein